MADINKITEIDTSSLSKINNVDMSDINKIGNDVIPPPVPPYLGVTHLLMHYDGGSLSEVYTDSSPDNNTITNVNNCQQLINQKKFGVTSGRFTSSSDYLQISTPSWTWGNSDFTADCWMFASGNMSTLLGWPWGDYVAGNNNSVSLEWYLGVPIANFNLQGGQNCLVNWPGSAVSYGVFHHIAIERYDGYVKLYVNGTSVGTPYNVGTSTIQVGSGDFRICGDPDGGVNYHDGYMDEFRIHIGEAVFKGNFAVPTSPYTN